jgi:pimeloyl-ACP methyl ester carboxylesterase
MTRPALRKIAVAGLGVAGALYVSAGVALFFVQRSLVYHPTPAVTVAGAEPLALESRGETIRLWTQNVAAPGAALYFGGNSEEVSKNLAPLAAALPGRAIYLVNYRGFGGSTGSPSEEGLFLDALAAYDRVRKSHSDLCVIGRSLGSGVAAYLASERKVEALVLVTPYDSIENVAQARYPLYPISWLLRDKFDTLARVPRIKARTLALLAENDWVIPPERSAALVAAFPQDQISVKTVPGTAHNSMASSPLYWSAIGAFCAAPATSS